MKTLTVELTADEVESILDALEHAEEDELFDKLKNQFTPWFNAMDDKGQYINREER